MTDHAAETANPNQPEVRAVVLLDAAPAGIGEVLELLQPGAGEKLAGFPANFLTVAVNGVDVGFELNPQPLVARELDYALAQSPVRHLVEPAVAQHGAFLVLTARSGEDVFDASNVLSNVAAMYADDDNGLAVWLPDADRLVTDVLYAGEVSQRPGQVWFNTIGARLDETTSIAHTIGVGHLGGQEVQLRSTTLDPAAAFTELRAAVADQLESRTFPAPGATIMIAGQPHVLTPAPSVLGMGTVLDAVPTGAATAGALSADEAETAPKRRGWFRRR